MQSHVQARSWTHCGFIENQPVSIILNEMASQYIPTSYVEGISSKVGTRMCPGHLLWLFHDGSGSAGIWFEPSWDSQKLDKHSES